MSRRAPHKAHAGHERWLVSYADFITLLFAFFVVLYASSRADQKKQRQISQAIDSAFHALGIFPDAMRKPKDLKNISAISRDEPVTPMNVVMGEDVLAPEKVQADLNRVQRQLEKMLSNQIASHSVSIQMSRNSLVISLREAGFFPSGSATPRPASLPILWQIGSVLGKTPYEIRVEGHTDNVPIHNDQFDSNWELSAGRATHIAHIFLSTHDVLPEHLSAAGFAEFRPVAPNDSAPGRAENRRVDLVVMPRTMVNLAAPGPSGTAKNSWHKITE